MLGLQCVGPEQQLNSQLQAYSIMKRMTRDSKSEPAKVQFLQQFASGACDGQAAYAMDRATKIVAHDRTIELCEAILVVVLILVNDANGVSQSTICPPHFEACKSVADIMTYLGRITNVPSCDYTNEIAKILHLRNVRCMFAMSMKQYLRMKANSDESLRVISDRVETVEDTLLVQGVIQGQHADAIDEAKVEKLKELEGLQVANDRRIGRLYEEICDLEAQNKDMEYQKSRIKIGMAKRPLNEPQNCALVALD